VTGYKDTYVGRMDNYLIRHPNCVNVTKWNAVICSGTYAQVGRAGGPGPQLLVTAGWLGGGEGPKHSIYRGREESKWPWKRKGECFTKISLKPVKSKKQTSSGT
jgi:hypothetical protein